MSLEQALKTSKFQSPGHRAIVNVLFTASYVRKVHNHMLKRYGLTIPQYNVLRILRGAHPQPATVRMIAERMIDENSNASRVVDKLKEKGLVSRFTSELDRRLVDINITPKGLELLKEIDPMAQEFSMGMEKALNPQEILELNRLLDTFRDYGVSSAHGLDDCDTTAG
ncbi:MAG: MarR family transcriptional regulator [Bacteroidetes bacterium]|nr:MarR family transcriptional regulator [Bacteroidota bacterium]